MASAEHAPASGPRGTPSADILAEARRVMAAAQEAGVPLRLVGGLAVVVSAGAAPLLPRECKDIDLATRRGAGPDVAALLEALGYVGDRRFNGLNGHRRLLFADPAHERQVDVFIGDFQMCHSLPIQDRLLLAPQTLATADLLLTKLQIFALNEKDQRDILTLLYHHPLADSDAGTEVNAAHVARLCAGDWGLWRTCTMNLERVRAAVARYGLGPEQEALITNRVDDLRRRIDEAPKGARWKLRARVGERVKWYDEPEEVG